jgi:hypothetical protein
MIRLSTYLKTYRYEQKFEHNLETCEQDLIVIS